MSGFYNQPGNGPPFGQQSYDPYRNTGQQIYPRPEYTSPTSNPHTGMHPSSYSQGIPYAAAALGATSSSSSSSLGMSVSPPHWVSGNAPWPGSGSFVGSFGALGTSFGRERDREIEARYVRDFACCGRQLNGMHDLLEHYEEEHANLAPDARMAAISAVQAAPSTNSFASTDVPTPPGMMDIEMDEPVPATFLNRPIKPSYSISAPPSPWATAFRPGGTSTPPQCLPPSLLSYNPSTTVGMRPQHPIPMTTEELQAKAMRKAQRKADRAAAREEASTSDIEGEKRFPCPIEGCGKVYKQANGLKYHLTRSINSGHGNVAAMGGIRF